MDILLGLAIAFVILLISVIQNIGLWWPLLAVNGLFFLIHHRRGYQLSKLWLFFRRGARKAWPVFSILLPIGAVVSSWFAAGTVPALVYYGTQLIHPQYFVLLSFILTGIVSILTGTSFGAAGTIGVALMIMAKSNNMPNLNLVAGAILSGAYVGDRCSPLSSSAYLITHITHTNIYKNLKNMMLTGLIPLGITLLVYGLFSYLYPLPESTGLDTSVSQKIADIFNLNGVTLFPAILVLFLAVMKINVKLTLLLSWGIACLIAITIQSYSIPEILNSTLWGFQLDPSSELAPMLRGGGLWLMAKVCLIVWLSTGLAGVLTSTKSLDWVNNRFKRVKTQRHLFTGTIVISVLAAAFGCTQTIAAVLTHQLISPHYRQQGRTPYRIASDLENTAILLAAIIPWNVAGLVPIALIMGDVGCIPYAVYLYLVPLCNWVWPNLWALDSEY